MERDGDPRGSVLPGIPRRTASAAPSQNLNVGYIGYISPVVTGRGVTTAYGQRSGIAPERGREHPRFIACALSSVIPARALPPQIN